MTFLPRPAHFEHKSMLWLEVTNFCNLTCAHCYNASGPRESLTPSISPERYRQILGEAKRMGFRWIQFIGGEPLFYPHLQELIDHALELSFEGIEIFSNLTAVPPWLLDVRYRAIHLATSFYSTDADVHDEICASRNSFKRTVASIRKVVDAGFKLRVGFIEMEANRGHFESAKAFLKDLGVDDVGYDAVRQFGRAETGRQMEMTELCGKCSNGNLSIDVSGNVSACIMSKPWAFGNINDTSLAALFDSENRRRFVQQLEGIAVTAVCDPEGCWPNCWPSCQPNCSPGTVCSPHCTPAG